MPRIKDYFGGDIVIHKVLSTFGMGESMVAEKLATLESQLPPYIRLAYLPGYGMVKLRLTGRGSEKARLEEEINRFYEDLKAP
ncbi:hypothetical protein [Niabella hibiscisoli]|uniref:hypothetical protein n=1 Tax=Niabella hibiscisoli TaxID=1825928 RepID=UPI001F0F9EE8|nr:hypothetical protein [Niabella hibiscisoli]MCH5714925.1 hypothetical protein [Niabella hibiscisoli]